jgi:hypothetical protein
MLFFHAGALREILLPEGSFFFAFLPKISYFILPRQPLFVKGQVFELMKKA